MQLKIKSKPGQKTDIISVLWPRLCLERENYGPRILSVGLHYCSNDTSLAALYRWAPPSDGSSSEPTSS